MLSSLTDEGSSATVQALELGAVDFLCKPSRTDDISSVLKEKLVVASGVDISRLKAGAGAPMRRQPRPSKATLPTSVRMMVIGSSTGGPKALSTVIPALPEKLNCLWHFTPFSQ